MAYDLSEAFEAIEDELISSMMRNLKLHQAEESRLGFEWEQWQALQLRALEDYRRRNMKKFPPRFNKLNLQIDEMLKRTYNDGRTAQERKILKAIRSGFKAPFQPYSGSAELEGSFFGVNERKLDALINAVDNDMERAEYAVLRRADDQYRQVIFNSQVYANTGAGTYQKAVDMATRDFLRAGLDCVEYKDGSRHTLEDYADMAIRTANKRAYLQGEGSMRDEWGIPTVIMNKRSCPCPRCAPFVGKVFIDDVWSGGQAVSGTEEGISPVTGLRYPLLSAAIKKGLYHPRCKDVHSTYFEGITTPPEGSQYTADDLDAMAQQYSAEQKQGYCERQEKRYSRMSKYSLDEDNQRMYGARAKQWSEKAEAFGNVINSFEKPVEKSAGSGIINITKYSDSQPRDDHGRWTDGGGDSGSGSSGSGSGEREEAPRRSDGGKYSVDWEKVQSKEYDVKISKISDDEKVCKSIKTRAKWALNNRDGKDTEELYAIDLATGKEIGQITNQNISRGVKRTSSFEKRLAKADSEGTKILLIHNHPTGMPPSPADINELLKLRNAVGITVGHDGSIYKYTKPTRMIDLRDWDVSMRHYNNFSEKTAQEKTMLLLSQKYGFTVEEL